jgi:hypothetical protein
MMAAMTTTVPVMASQYLNAYCTMGSRSTAQQAQHAWQDEMQHTDLL